MSSQQQSGSLRRRTLSRFAAIGGTALIVSTLLMTVAVVTASAAGTGAKTGAPVGAVWTNPGNVNASDDAYATAIPANGGSLSQAYNSFAFGIGGGSIITDISVSVEAKSSDSSGCTLDVQISGDGGATLLPATSTINLTGTDTPYTRSGTWGQVWDPTQLTGTTFRVVLKANNDSGNSCDTGSTTYVDAMSVTVTYDTIKNGTTNAAISTAVCDKADFNFVVDMSGSIGVQGSAPSNLPALQAGITSFVNTFQASGDGVYSGTRFNGSTTAALTSGYQSAATFKSAIAGLSGPTGLTPTSAGIAAAAGNTANDRVGVQNIMFVVTDGSPNNPPGSPLDNPSTWLSAANDAIGAANTARGSFVVEAVYLSTPGDPGDTTLPFSNPDGDASWASSVMKQIGGGSYLPADFSSFATDLLNAIHCTPDVKVVKTADNSPIAAGDTAAFTIAVSNIGKGTAKDVKLSDPLPAGVTWAINPSVPGCSITTGTLNCSFAMLASDDVQTIHISGATDVNDCGTLPNTATVSASNEPDNVKGNNTSSATITVQCGSIKIIKDAVPNDSQDFAFTTTGNGLPGFSLDDDADATLPNNRTFSVVPGAYSVKETAVAGWKLTGLTCNDTNGSVDLSTGLATLNVSANEAVVCTYTNTKLGSITVKKLTSPSKAPGSFGFSGDLSGSIGDGGTITLGNLLPGVYHTTEADPTPPYDLGSITCNDNNSSGDIATGIATFNLDAGENITCTFTNVQRGSINIIKDAQPNDPQDFAFTTGAGLTGFSLDDDSDPTLSNTKAFTNVKPGTYSVTEGAVTGWDLTGLVCQGTNGSAGVQANTTANITLTPGGSVTCTYTNTKGGQVIVKKVMVGGTGTFTYAGTPSGTISANNGTISAGVKPGTYVATEAATAGWDLTAVSCDDSDSVGSVGNANASFHVAAGETVTCTFTNTKRGHIIVDKVTNPAADPQEFTFTPSYNGGQTFKLADATTPNDSGALIPGTYSVSEAAMAGWDLTGVTCSDGSDASAVHLDAGETVTCTFTNTKAGHITVDKVTNPAADTASFSFDPSWSVVDFSLTDQAAPHDSGLLAPGVYSVTEAALNGWDLTSATCSGQNTPGEIHLQAGQTVNCVFTNTKRGHILVDKVTDPSGDPQSFEFKTNYSNNFFLTDTSDPNDSGALKPGSYAIGELAANGWDLTNSSCSDQSPVNAIGLQPGETVTCTFTNTKRGSITVEKQTSPDGASGSFTFTGDVAGSLGDGQSKTVSDLKPGTYTSTEAAQAGWDLGAIVCNDANSKTPSSGNTATGTATFHLDPGENVTCVFTNVERGSITIIKDAQPDSSQNFSFTTTGNGLSSFGLVDNGDAAASTKVFQSLVAGTYSVTEGSVDGWDLKDLSCNALGGSKAEIDGATANLTLAEGGSITCTYTNSKPSIQVVKTAGDAADGAEFVTGPGPVTYTYVVKNTGTVALQNITVTDDNGTPGTGDDFAATCPKTTLAAGESMTCSKTVTVTSDRTNTALAHGSTVKGTGVDDTDSAVVRIPVIEINKVADDHDVEPNQIVTYTLDVSVASGPVTDAVVTDDLPVGQTYQAGSSTPNEPVITNGGKTLTWTFDSLDNGDPTVTITYNVKIDADASTDAQVNQATVCVSELKDCASDTERIIVQKPGIDIVKTAGDAEDGDVYRTEPGNVTYTYVVTNTGPLPLKDVVVKDDNGTPGNSVDDFTADCPKTTLAVEESMTCTATVAVIHDTTNIAVVNGSTPEGNPVQATDDAKVVILVHGLIIDKSNNAPIDPTLHIPEAPVGSTVTYTLTYTFSGDPVTNGVIKDVLPAGVEYTVGSATNSDEFTFDSYDSGSRTLTWNAATVTKNGTLTYKVKVLPEAEGFGPLTNAATIKSDQTKVDDAKSDIFVPTIPEAETSKPTPPQTDVFDGSGGTAGPGISLLLMFGILGVLIVGLVFITPVPEAARRRNRR